MTQGKRKIFEIQILFNWKNKFLWKYCVHCMSMKMKIILSLTLSETLQVLKNCFTHTTSYSNNKGPWSTAKWSSLKTHGQYTVHQEHWELLTSNYRGPCKFETPSAKNGINHEQDQILENPNQTWVIQKRYRMWRAQTRKTKMGTPHSIERTTTINLTPCWSKRNRYKEETQELMQGATP